jgi:N-dimethylarginine dimethylaminohydrolase
MRGINRDTARFGSAVYDREDALRTIRELREKLKSREAAIAELEAAAKFLCDQAYSMDKEFASVNHAYIDALRAALAAVGGGE